jgi:colicin import membrane protein
MSAPATITDEQICDAGQQIITAGRRVTGYGLRERLGGWGDPRCMLAVWQQTQPQRDMTPSDEPQAAAPPPLPPDLAAQRTEMV